MALTPAEWFDNATEAYAQVLDALARHGIRPDPALLLVSAEAPTPYYEPATKTIGIGMPDPATVKGRLYWLYAARVLGYGGVDEVVARQAEQMPFMVAHEVAHHLRQHYGAPIANDFAEEQVANAIAMAFVHEHPTYRRRIPAMREAASKATVTLSLLVPEATPFVGGFRISDHDELVELEKLSADELRALGLVAEATDVSLDELLVEAGVVSVADLSAADAARDGAEAYFNAVYMTNLLEYGYFHMAWISAYLEREDPPSLAETVEDYLLTPDWERARENETLLLVRQLLKDAPDVIAPAVVETLGERWAQDVLADLLGVLPICSAWTQAAILLGLARHAAEDPRSVEAARAGMGSSSADVRAAAAALLERSGATPGAGRTAILDLLASGDGHCQRAGLRAAAELADPALVEGLLTCLDTGPVDIRTLALDGLGALPPDPSLGDRITFALLDSDEGVRVSAIRGVGRHCSPLGLGALMALFDDPVESVRREVAAAITGYGADAAPALRALAGGWRARTEAALLLHRLGGDEVGALLGALLTELVSAARTLARPLSPGLRGGAPGDILVAAVAEQRRKACFLALRVIAAQRPGQAMEHALEGLRWGDSSTRPGLLQIARRALPPDLWPLLDGRPTSGETGPSPAAPLTGEELDDLLAGFDPFLRELAGACLHPLPTQEPSMLSDLEKLVFLRSIPLLSDVELVDVRLLAQECEMFQYRAGELIFEQGDEGDRLFLVTTGRVVVEQVRADGSRVRLRELGPGAYFGETAFFADIRRSARVSAVVDSMLLGLRREPVLRAGVRHPAILLGMIRAMSERMADTNETTRP